MNFEILFRYDQLLLPMRPGLPPAQVGHHLAGEILWYLISLLGDQRSCFWLSLIDLWSLLSSGRLNSPLHNGRLLHNDASVDEPRRRMAIHLLWTMWDLWSLLFDLRSRRRLALYPRGLVLFWSCSLSFDLWSLQGTSTLTLTIDTRIRRISWRWRQAEWWPSSSSWTSSPCSWWGRRLLEYLLLFKFRRGDFSHWPHHTTFRTIGSRDTRSSPCSPRPPSSSGRPSGTWYSTSDNRRVSGDLWSLNSVIRFIFDLSLIFQFPCRHPRVHQSRGVSPPSDNRLLDRWWNLGGERLIFDLSNWSLISELVLDLWSLPFQIAPLLVMIALWDRLAKNDYK